MLTTIKHGQRSFITVSLILRFVVGLLVTCLVAAQTDSNASPGLQKQDDNIKVSYSYSNTKSTTANISNVDVLLSLQGENLSSRVPVSLSLILDASENVVTDRQDVFLKQSLQILLDNTVIGQDYLGLSTFATSATEVIELILVDSQAKLSQLKNIVDNLQFGGASALSQALQIGLNQQLGNITGLPAVKGVVIFNTGQPNVGIVDGERIQQLISVRQQATDNPIRVFTIGQGSAAEPETMEIIAREGDGAYFYLRSPPDIRKAMGISFAGLVSTYYQDIVMNINVKGEAQIKEVVSSGKVSSSPSSAEITVRDLLGEQQIDLLVSLEVPIGSVDNLTEILDIQLGYQDNLRGVIEQFSALVEVDLLNVIPNPYGDITLLRFEIVDALTQVTKSISNQQVKEAFDTIQEAKTKVEEVKSGGVEEALNQGQQELQALEFEDEGGRRRKLLQRRTDQLDYFQKWLSALELVLDDVNNLVNLDDYKEAAAIIGGLQETILNQRLSFLPETEFASTDLLIELTGNFWMRKLAVEGLAPNYDFKPSVPIPTEPQEDLSSNSQDSQEDTEPQGSPEETPSQSSSQSSGMENAYQDTQFQDYVEGASSQGSSYISEIEQGIFMRDRALDYGQSQQPRSPQNLNEINAPIIPIPSQSFGSGPEYGGGLDDEMFAQTSLFSLNQIGKLVTSLFTTEEPNQQSNESQQKLTVAQSMEVPSVQDNDESESGSLLLSAFFPMVSQYYPATPPQLPPPPSPQPPLPPPPSPPPPLPPPLLPLIQPPPPTEYQMSPQNNLEILSESSENDAPRASEQSTISKSPLPLPPPPRPPPLPLPAPPPQYPPSGNFDTENEPLETDNPQTSEEPVIQLSPSKNNLITSTTESPSQLGPEETPTTAVIDLDQANAPQTYGEQEGPSKIPVATQSSPDLQTTVQSSLTPSETQEKSDADPDMQSVLQPRRLQDASYTSKGTDNTKQTIPETDGIDKNQQRSQGVEKEQDTSKSIGNSGSPQPQQLQPYPIGGQGNAISPEPPLQSRQAEGARNNQQPSQEIEKQQDTPQSTQNSGSPSPQYLQPQPTGGQGNTISPGPLLRSRQLENSSQNGKP